MPVSSSRIEFLPGRKRFGGDRDRNPFGCVIAGLDITIQVIDTFAVDRDVGPELSVANALGEIRVAVFADDLNDIDEQKTGTIGNSGQFERAFERAAFRLGWVSGDVFEYSSPRWCAAGR